MNLSHWWYRKTSGIPTFFKTLLAIAAALGAWLLVSWAIFWVWNRLPVSIQSAQGADGIEREHYLWVVPIAVWIGYMMFWPSIPSAMPVLQAKFRDQLEDLEEKVERMEAHITRLESAEQARPPVSPTT